MKIVLTGFMCSGKSRVGRTLARKLSLPFIDTDDLIVATQKMTIADLINQKGEAAFRTIEAEVVKNSSQGFSGVISTGGGVPLNAQNMAHLSQDGKVIWLSIKPETVLKRSGDLRTRPLIDPSNPLESIVKKLNEREPFYSKADYKIQVDEKNVDVITDEIIKWLNIKI